MGLVAVGALVCGVAAGEAYDGGAGGPAAEPTGPPAGSALDGAAWLEQDGATRIDEAAPRPSVRFPAGVGYREALERLLLAALGRGDLPAGAVLEPPLPAEVVLVRPGGAAQGLRLSLTAPWGYDEAGHIRAPSVAVPKDWTPERVDDAMALLRSAAPALAEGARVDAPELRPCQVAVGSAANRPLCRERT